MQYESAVAATKPARPDTRKPQQANTRVAKLAANFTVEVTPRAAEKITNFRDHLPESTGVYVTSLAGSHLSDTVKTCIKLRAQGMRPIPHITARSLSGKRELEEYLKQLTGEAGVRDVLAIAGAAGKPVGDFDETMQMLDTGLFEKYAIDSIGVAGHPEGSRDMPDEATALALKRKNAFSEQAEAHMYLLTQFFFDAGPVIEWAHRIEKAGNRLPIIVGLPGLATVKSLLSHARACGIGSSMKVLMGQATNMNRLLMVQAPDSQLIALAEHKHEHPECSITGVHIFPLGRFARSAEWVISASNGELEREFSDY